MFRLFRLVLLCLLGTVSAATRLDAADTAPVSYVIQTIAGSDNSGDGSALSAALIQPEGIAVDHAGNVYVADAADHRVRRISRDGSIRTVAGTGVAGFGGDGGPATQAQLNQPYGLAIDKTGVLYIADLGNARVRKVGLDGAIQTIAGGGTLPARGSGQGGPATSTQLMAPRNLALNADGSLYVSDFGANQIYFVRSDGILMLAAGNGTAGSEGVGTSALLAELNAPAGLASDTSGTLYIADSGNNLVRKVYGGVIITVFRTQSPTGLALTTDGMLYVAAASYFGTVDQTTADVPEARDVTVDASGNVYLTGGQLVSEISNGFVTTIAGGGTGIGGSATSTNFGGDGGPAVEAQLNSPSGVVVASSGVAAGNWYVADTANNRIRMVTAPGLINSIAGTGQAGFKGDNGPAAAAQLSAPRGIAIDSTGNLYIADTGNNAVRRITPAGTISTIANHLNNPVSVAVDGQGSIYVADSGDNQIVQVTASGAASTFAKIQGPLAVAVNGSGDVLVADASQVSKVASDGTVTPLAKILKSPAAIVAAADGTVFIADTGANVIRQLSASGTLTAIAGTGTAGFSGDSGAALSAQLSAPAGIAIGPNGVLLVADSANNRIRSLTPSKSEPQNVQISVVNAASNALGPIAPGEIITIFGTGLDTTSTQVLFDGHAATLFYTSDTQINALAPASLAPNSNTNLTIAASGATIASASVRVVTAAPGIFTTGGATGPAAANNQDGSINSESNPAARGSVVSLYATGQGSLTGVDVGLTIAGYNAPLLYAGPAPGFPGLMQINTQIPGGFLPPGIQQVVLTIGGASSQAGVTLAIH